VYEALAGAALSAEDPERVVESVARLRRRHPKLSREDLAGKLTARAALACAAVGAVAGPVSFQALALDRLFLSIARVSGRPASPLERAAGAVASLLVAGAAEGLRRQAVRATRRLPERPSTVLPALAGALVGAVVGGAAAALAGQAARQYIFGGGRRRR
jgi:hypothetical protein